MKHMRTVAFLIVGLLAVSPAYAAVPNQSTTSPQLQVALTFDDGPYGTSTEAVLDILKRENVHATFFVVGKNVDKYPALTREILADGNALGNHSYRHSKHLASLGPRAFAKDLDAAEHSIASSTGTTPKIYRPPYGLLSKTMKRVLHKKGYALVLWNDDPQDWNASTTATNIERTTHAQEHNFTVLILHDGRDTHINYPRENMLGALPSIIEDFKKQGYVFVTFPLPQSATSSPQLP